MRVICAICKQRCKTYIGNEPDDVKSWVCGTCYNSLMKRTKNLEGTVDELNSTIRSLKSQLETIPDPFKNIFGY